VSTHLYIEPLRPLERRPAHGAFRVVPQRRHGEQTYVVVSPAGEELFLFTDVGMAAGEAAALNAKSATNRQST
jgi:hypothetical protein